MIATSAEAQNVLEDQRNIWMMLEDRVGLVSRRPRLSDDVCIRQIGDEFELMQLSTRCVLAITAEEARIAQRLDGELTLSELVASDFGVSGRIAVEPVLSLIERIGDADLLDRYPPNIYNQLATHLDRVGRERQERRALAIEQARAPKHDADTSAEAVVTDLPQWRPRNQHVAERARFLRSVSLFGSLDMWSIGALADAVSEHTFGAGSDVIRQGAAPDHFFIVRSGHVNVTQGSDEGGRERVARLGPGEWFGEEGLLENAPRNATVRVAADRPAQIFAFDARTFERIISDRASDFRGKRIVSRRRAMLERIPLFSALAAQDLDHLSRALGEVKAPSGTILFRQGDRADRFYVIAQGSVGVVKDGQPIAKLTAGEFFGETALLFTDERTATVAATEDTVLLALNAASFRTFIKDHLLHRRDMMPTVFNRLNSVDPA